MQTSNNILNNGGYYCYDVFNNNAGENGNLKIHVASFKNESDAIEWADLENNPHLSVELGHYIYTNENITKNNLQR